MQWSYLYTCRHDDFTVSPFGSINLLIISRFVKYSNIAFSFSGSIFHTEIFHSKITSALGSLEKLGDFCRYISLSDGSALFLGLYLGSSCSWIWNPFRLAAIELGHARAPSILHGVIELWEEFCASALLPARVHEGVCRGG